MKEEVLEPAQAAELLARRGALVAEAAAVMEDLKLMPVLSRVGTVRQVGSSASGLMVWRDIDINVVSPGIGISEAFDTMREFVAHPQVTKLRYMNESGKLNPTGELRDERYYFALFYAADGGEEWKVDISFWLKDVPRSEGEDLRNLQEQLTPESRLAILWIKDVWHRLPAYRVEVCSVDIYDAVLRHGVRTPDGFDRYLAERGKPAREARGAAGG
jgi:hypothetical protein